MSEFTLTADSFGGFIPAVPHSDMAVSYRFSTMYILLLGFSVMVLQSYSQGGRLTPNKAGRR